MPSALSIALDLEYSNHCIQIHLLSISPPKMMWIWFVGVWSHVKWPTPAIQANRFFWNASTPMLQLIWAEWHGLPSTTSAHFTTKSLWVVWRITKNWNCIWKRSRSKRRAHQPHRKYSKNSTATIWKDSSSACHRTNLSNWIQMFAICKLNRKAMAKCCWRANWSRRKYPFIACHTTPITMCPVSSAPTIILTTMCRRWTRSATIRVASLMRANNGATEWNRAACVRASTAVSDARHSNVHHSNAKATMFGHRGKMNAVHRVHVSRNLFQAEIDWN